MNDLSKKHIETLQDFVREIAQCLDDDSDGRAHDLVDAIRFAIERLSNQERIAADLQRTIRDAGRTDLAPIPTQPVSDPSRQFSGIVEAIEDWDHSLTIQFEKQITLAAIGDRVTLIL